ncbi:amidase family protein [Lentzea albidocapillata]|uniref:Asp-tRNAAsn/Glu-tRNAGln amidotransferase A subunit n=1 Tax=Lentzea albidocapillata TaxID=40571 RepID=A0A1W2ER86_9PSEU|nr:amidase [Lentzea albidocapillata]SMD12175.1 Asp-tRNAAsn/Glu-tRNAGln amidotransferase A subunit [Lentzea albidocapillata]
MNHRQPPPALLAPLRERGPIDPAEADAWARHADARYRAAVELHPVTDPRLRIGVKDTVDVAGFATRLGLRRHRAHPAATAAALAGVPAGSITAKLVTTELNIGLDHGCVNPYFPHLDPAGSSTGCAVAVAANICDVAMGTDTVASVRLPAAACGLTGLRMTSDKRLLEGVFTISGRLDAPGWITRTVDDLAHFWEQHDPALGLVGREILTGVPLTVGVVAEALDADLEPEIRASVDAAVAALTDAGHRVRTVELGELFTARGTAYQLCAREAADTWQRTSDQIDDELAEATRLALASGRSCDDVRYAELIGIQDAYQVRAAELLAGTGIWLLPAGTMMPRNIHTEPAVASTIPDPAELATSPRVNYAAMASLLGLPSLTFPVAHSPGFDAPISLQLVGPRWSEAELIGAAAEINALVGVPRYPLGGRTSGGTA